MRYIIMSFFMILILLMQSAIAATNFGTSQLIIANEKLKPKLQQTHPILLGLVDSSTAQISVLSKDSSLQFSIRSINGSSSWPDNVIVNTHPSSEWIAYKIHFLNLRPSTEYTFQVTRKDGQSTDMRTFSTFSNNKNSLRFAIASCMRDREADAQGAMWQALANENPEFLILGGDNVYVDEEDTVKIKPSVIWRRYIETRTRLDLFKQHRLIPTLATWDDHDYGQNNSGKEFKYKHESAQIFRAMYAQDAISNSTSTGKTIETAYQVAGFKFVGMDNRTHRDSRYLPNGEHWGNEQTKWLINIIKSSPHPTWIINGSQFFGGYRMGWSFEDNHRSRFFDFLDGLNKHRTPVAFISGDVHYSEVMKIEREILNYDTIEITSSSMHSNSKKPQSGNKRRIASTGEYNFNVVDAQITPAGFNYQVRSIGAHGRMHYVVSGSVIP